MLVQNDPDFMPSKVKAWRMWFDEDVSVLVLFRNLTSRPGPTYLSTGPPFSASHPP